MHAPMTELSSPRIRRMIELARAHVESGGGGAAGAYYRMILKDTSPPKNGVERLAHGEACVWYARKALHEGRIGTAGDWYQLALRADPLAIDYRLEYILKALLPMAAYKTARIHAETASKIDPTNKEVWHVLGGIEQIVGNVDASIAAYDKQIELDPNDPDALLDRSTIALDTADYATVKKLAYPCLKTQRRADALHVLAMAAFREGDHEGAITLYDEAILAGCHDPELAEWNKSIALHSIGRYKEGWAAHEARGRQKTDEPMALLMRRFAVPILDLDKHPAPARIHVHQEMGHGDIIAMARYLPLLLERGYEVHLEVMESMVGLMQRSFPAVKVMARAIDYPGGIGIPDFDYHIPMLSLPSIFKTDIDTIPWSGPYLKPDPNLVDHYHQLLPIGRRIGLCWSSGIRNDGLWISEYGRLKSMAFKDMYNLLYYGDDCFVSLQVGPERAELKEYTGYLPDVLPAKPSWDDTAALVACLDVIVTVDTSVSHLAGALGKSVMLCMHRQGSWHYMAEREGTPWQHRSPWYPATQVFRQKQDYVWDDVITQIGTVLHEGVN